MASMAASQARLLLCLLLVLGTTFLECQASKKTCVSCNEVVKPRDCRYVEECGPHEDCYIDAFVTSTGYIRYNVGCRDEQLCSPNGKRGVLDQITRRTQNNHDVLTCTTCCKGQLCNMAGCGENGTIVHRGPICYTCDQQNDGAKCNVISECGRDEACLVSRTMVTQASDIVYQTTCINEKICRLFAKAPAVGRRDLSRKARATVCNKCCKDDLCNHNCTTSAHQTVSATSTTPTTTAPTTKPTTTPHPPADCKDFQDRGLSKGNGIYSVTTPTGNKNVYCDMTTAGGGWTVIQRRVDGSVDFNRNSTAYNQGFGDLNGNFWTGLNQMHSLTSGKPYKLRVELTAGNGTKYYEEYDSFTIGPGPDYRIHVSGPSGTAGDSLLGHNNKPFTTQDKDRDDKKDGNCAAYLGAAWWFHNCYDSSLNGYYSTPGTVDCGGISWNSVGYCTSLKSATMMIKPK